MFQNSNIQFVKRCTLISSLTVCLFSGPIKHSGLLKELDKIENTNEQVNFKLDNWINFDLKTDVKAF